MAEAQVSGQDLAQIRLLHKISIAVAVLAFGVLVVGFGLVWPAYYQVVAGLIAYIAIEWQRRLDRRIKAATLSSTAQGGTVAGT